MELLWTYYGLRLKKSNINGRYKRLKIVIFNKANYFVFVLSSVSQSYSCNNKNKGIRNE